MGWLFRRGCNLHFLQGGTPGEAHALSRLFFVSVTEISSIWFVLFALKLMMAKRDEKRIYFTKMMIGECLYCIEYL